MKAHTSNFKEQIKTMGRELDSKITYTLNGVNVELGKEQLNSITPTYQGALLKSVMKELDIDSNVYIPEKTILNYQFGVKVNGEYEYINFGNYVVYKAEKQEDTNSYKLTCYDKMLYSMIDYEKMDITYPISIRDYIKAICDKLGLTFKNYNSTFANYNKKINNELYLDTNGNSIGYTFRDIFDELSQVTASCICINENDELEIRYINDTSDIIDEEFLKDVNISFGERYGAINTIVLSRSADSDNIYYPEVLSENPYEFKISDNQIMNFNDRSDYLPDIYEKLNGLEFYLNDFSSTGICYYELLDRYNVQIGDNTYSCIMLNDEINITQGLEENISTEMPEETQTDYTKADKTDRKINQTYLIVDKQNQQITSVVSQVDDQNSKIATISQQVGELNSKITNIANITASGETIYADLTLDNINKSEPLEIKIHPNIYNISYLYPRDNLYPSDDLYPTTRTLRFKNTKTDEIFDYELPDDLLYYDSENYDEFYLNYDSEACYITKKCGYNDDGSIYLLDKPVTKNYEYPKIYLTDGDYKISLLGYSNGYLYVRLMAANLYTTQFATKVELSSAISQTSEEINLEVSKKVGNDEVISRINQTSETITIEANKVNIGGVITAINNNTTTTIDGNKITTGSITTNQIKSGAITADKVSSDIITTNNFSAQQINADNITSGTISTDRLESKVITTDNFSAQNINADKITSGTINGTNVNITNLNASNITSGSFSANRVSGGTLTGANIDVYSGTGFLRYLASQSIHPYVSALNMAYGTGNGLSFRSSSYRTDLGSPLGHLSVGDAQLLLEAYSGSGRNMYVAGPSISLVTNSGTRNSTGDYAGSIYVYASESVSLNARNGAVYAGNGTSGSNSRVAVDSSGPSSRNLKENITDFEDYDSALRLLKNMKIYNYNYKYKLSDKKEQYGFIIDDLLDDEDAQRFLYFKDDKAIPNKEGYFDYQRADEEPDNENIINFKRYDEEMLVKYLLITNKALLKKIEELEEKINGKN